MHFLRVYVPAEPITIIVIIAIILIIIIVTTIIVIVIGVVRPAPALRTIWEIILQLQDTFTDRNIQGWFKVGL